MLKLKPKTLKAMRAVARTTQKLTRALHADLGANRSATPEDFTIAQHFVEHLDTVTRQVTIYCDDHEQAVGELLEQRLSRLDAKAQKAQKAYAKAQQQLARHAPAAPGVA